MNALLIDRKKDNVAVVTEDITKGSAIRFMGDQQEEEVIAADDIPIYHKTARRPIRKGSPVIKYGEVIGLAACNLNPGDWVNENNLLCSRNQSDVD